MVKGTHDHRASEKEPEPDQENPESNSGSNLTYMQHDISRGFPRYFVGIGGCLERYNTQNLREDGERSKRVAQESLHGH